MTMLPTWARLIWVAVLVVVAVVHAWHVISISGQSRWWHLVHTAMAAGMVAMYAADPMRQAGLDRVLLVTFTALAVVLAGVLVLVAFAEGVPNPLWALAVADTAAMAFMAAVMLWPHAIAHVVSWIVVGYLCVEAIGWILGGWDRLPVLRRPSVRLRGHDSIDVRISLALMLAGMASMIAAMVTG